MQIRKGLNTDLARLEYCDFSFTVSQIARGPFINAGQVAGFITASLSWNRFISVDYIAIDSSQRRAGAANKLMAAAHIWARGMNAAELKLETQNVNVPACLFYRNYGFTLGGYDRYLYNALPEKMKLRCSGITC